MPSPLRARTHQIGIPCILMRGGTSKGPFFLADDLPSDRKVLEQVLLARIRRTPWFRTFLHGVNLAVLASLTSAALALGRDAIVDVPATLLCAAAMLAMAWKKVDAHWIVGAGLAVGLIRLALF